MPSRTDYAGLSLAEALLGLAERYSEGRTRHISRDEEDLVVRAADVLDREAPELRAFA
ncbi:MAG: hypothetical protein RIE08_08990 [Acidimicrobiales bacterium]